MIRMLSRPIYLFISWWACVPPVDLRFNSSTRSVSFTSDKYLEILYIRSKAWLAKPETVNLFTVQLRCDLELLQTLLLCRWRSEGRSSIPDFSPSLGSQRWRESAKVRGCFPRKGGDTLRSERGVGIVCVINESVVPKLSFNVSAPSKNISFRVLRLGLRFMRPNLQAMCARIKGTWDCLFMSDPGKFPVSCLSEALAKSMMGRWSPSVPW